MTENAQSALIAEQLRHTIDLLRAETEALRMGEQHTRDLLEHRLLELERKTADYEQRLRLLQDSATQFKVLASLASGGGLLSLINVVRALLN